MSEQSFKTEWDVIPLQESPGELHEVLQQGQRYTSTFCAFEERR